MATTKMKTVLVALGVFLPAWLMAVPPSLSATGDTSPQQVGLLEHRFFFHQYSRDPLEKRLERLELLIFGSIQGGTNDERIARIKTTVAERDRQSAGQAKTPEKKPPATAEAHPGAAKGSSSQYPALNTLEWRALKKTYPQDSLDERLERLETKVFGQSSPAMAYADRVERLNRTLGIGASQEHSTGPLGPKPKAVPRGQYFGFGAGPNAMPVPNMPFSSINPWDMNNQFNEMFRQLDQQMQQMQQMMQLPPGEYQWEYETPAPGQQQSPVKPSLPNLKPHPSTPAPRHQQLPPYYDPNAT